MPLALIPFHRSTVSFWNVDLQAKKGTREFEFAKVDLFFLLGNFKNWNNYILQE